MTLNQVVTVCTAAAVGLIIIENPLAACYLVARHYAKHQKVEKVDPKTQAYIDALDAVTGYPW